MLAEIPQLEFLPLEDLIIHEWHDEQRTPPLIERIRANGVLRNPPIVTPLPDSSGRYMVLDGANRITALRKMSFPHALVQVVPADDPGLNLENWNHVVWGLAPKDLFAGIREIEEINLVPTRQENPEPDLWGECNLSLVQLPNANTFTVCTPVDELVRRVQLLNAIVDSYKERARLDRTNGREVQSLKEIYPDLSGLVIFPKLDVKEVLQLAAAGYLLPAGITRFTISPRALHVNYPLEKLAADKPIQAKNAALQRWIQQRIACKGVRYYAEPTFLFDE